MLQQVWAIGVAQKQLRRPAAAWIRFQAFKDSRDYSLRTLSERKKKNKFNLLMIGQTFPKKMLLLVETNIKCKELLTFCDLILDPFFWLLQKVSITIMISTLKKRNA